MWFRRRADHESPAAIQNPNCKRQRVREERCFINLSKSFIRVYLRSSAAK